MKKGLMMIGFAVFLTGCGEESKDSTENVENVVDTIDSTSNDQDLIEEELSDELIEESEVKLSNSTDSISYALGLIDANLFGKNFPEVNYLAFKSGFSDKFDGKSLKLTDELINKRVRDYLGNKGAYPTTKSEDGSLTSIVDTVSYGIGVSICTDFQLRKFNLSKNMFFLGFEDKWNGKATALKDEDANVIIEDIANPAKKEGRVFLEKNKQRKGVKVTASGLQYEVIRAGSGAVPGPNDKVKTHYHGTFIDGRVFDSSVQRGEPLEFPVKGVIAGWTEALQMMKTGAKWKLYVPYNLAYGERGAPPSIPPYSTLVFEVELIDIVK